MLITFSIKILKDAEAHLLLATQERSYYKSLIDTAKAVLQQIFTVNGELKLPCLHARLSPGTQITMHYSFDMAQQVSMGKKNSEFTDYSIIGPLSIRPTAARTHVPSDTTKVWDFWHLL